MAVFSAVLGNFSFGFALVYPSPVIPALEAHSDPALRLDRYRASWFGVRCGTVSTGGIQREPGSTKAPLCLPAVGVHAGGGGRGAQRHAPQ